MAASPKSRTASAPSFASGKASAASDFRCVFSLSTMSMSVPRAMAISIHSEPKSRPTSTSSSGGGTAVAAAAMKHATASRASSVARAAPAAIQMEAMGFGALETEKKFVFFRKPSVAMR